MQQPQEQPQKSQEQDIILQKHLKIDWPILVSF